MQLSIRWRKVVLAMCAVAVFFLIFMVAIVIFVPASDDTTAEAVAPTPVATHVLIPTPEPTITPIPTRPLTEAQECPTPEEQVYFDTIQSDLLRLGTLTTMMSEDLGRPAANQMLYTDDLWQMTMANHFDLLPRYADDLLKHDVPPRAAEVGRLMQRMVSEYQTAIAMYADGIANLDPDVLAEGEYWITLATDDVGYIKGQIASFCQLHGN